MYEILKETVCQYLSVPEFKTKWEDDQKKGAGFFYALTYPFILRFFQEHKPLSEALELKVALVFSWNPTICKLTTEGFERARSELERLESFAQQELRTRTILDVDLETAINKLWEPITNATSMGRSNSGVSVTKFLHFSFPDIFPMIDSKTMRSLAQSSVNRGSYRRFLLAWKEVYECSRTVFDQISDAMNMPVARVLDVVIFTPGGEG